MTDIIREQATEIWFSVLFCAGFSIMLLCIAIYNWILYRNAQKRGKPRMVCLQYRTLAISIVIFVLIVVMYDIACLLVLSHFDQL